MAALQLHHRRRWGRAGTIDLIGLCGYYGTLVMVLNTARIPLPDDAQPFEP